jgi:hypothetical protein
MTRIRVDEPPTSITNHRERETLAMHLAEPIEATVIAT